ncbi:hypothetical protein, partial [Clostridium sp. AM58-1XD]|uniref:hypothetical protein n=1 Tax=Clostridium sp. AM58-1XD TaxID=2292307 RepID=UPI000EBC45A3
ALVTLIFSLLNAEIVKIIFANDSLLNAEIVKIIFANDSYKSRLKKFFLSSCQSGFTLVGLSIVLLLRENIFEFIYEVLLLKLAHVVILFIKMYLGIYFCVFCIIFLQNNYLNGKGCF